MSKPCPSHVHRCSKRPTEITLNGVISACERWSHGGPIGVSGWQWPKKTSGTLGKLMFLGKITIFHGKTCDKWSFLNSYVKLPEGLRNQKINQNQPHTMGFNH